MLRRRPSAPDVSPRREPGGQGRGGQRAGRPTSGKGQGSRGQGGGRPTRARSDAGRAGDSPPRRSGRGERSLGGEQVEGRRAVVELLRAGRRPIREVWVSDTATPGLADELADAAAQPVQIRTVARARLDAAAGTTAPQGVIAWADELAEADLGALTRTREGGPRPFLVVLDGVSDPQNLGAILRTALSAGVTGVVLPRHRSALITPAVAKAAAGAIEHIPLAVMPGVAGAMVELAAAEVWTVGLDAEADQSVFALSVATEAVALVLGSEGRGLSRLVRDRCDLLARIPMTGPIGSLNVGAAAAVACFAVAERRRG